MHHPRAHEQRRTGGDRIAADHADPVGLRHAAGDAALGERDREAAREALVGLERTARRQAALAPVLRIANDMLVELERFDPEDEVALRAAIGRAAARWRARLEPSHDPGRPTHAPGTALALSSVDRT